MQHTYPIFYSIPHPKFVFLDYVAQYMVLYGVYDIE